MKLIRVIKTLDKIINIAEKNQIHLKIQQFKDVSDKERKIYCKMTDIENSFFTVEINPDGVFYILQLGNKKIIKVADKTDLIEPQLKKMIKIYKKIIKAVEGEYYENN
jgi:hypothetical protein